MRNFNDHLFDQLDAAAEHTGIPGLVTRAPRRRHFRWLPIVALTLATIGLGLGVARPDLALVARSLVMLGFALSVVLPIIGPVKPWGANETVDEFDRALRARAFLAGYASVSAAAMLGIWLVIGLGMIGEWPARMLTDQLIALAFYLMALNAAVPTLYSSWATRPLADED